MFNPNKYNKVPQSEVPKLIEQENEELMNYLNTGKVNSNSNSARISFSKYKPYPETQTRFISKNEQPSSAQTLEIPTSGHRNEESHSHKSNLYSDQTLEFPVSSEEENKFKTEAEIKREINIVVHKINIYFIRKNKLTGVIPPRDILKLMYEASLHADKHTEIMEKIIILVNNYIREEKIKPTHTEMILNQFYRACNDKTYASIMYEIGKLYGDYIELLSSIKENNISLNAGLSQLKEIERTILPLLKSISQNI